jgi:aryl-alcohol dehydrogenase-like predicted oxidoreductase
MASELAKLGLGAAQFRFEAQSAFGASRAGAASGAFRGGRSPEGEIADMLAIAVRSGMSLLDATTPFDSAETMLGAAMPPGAPFRVMIKAARADRGPDYVEAEARASLRRMGMTRADAIIVQSAGDLFGRFGPQLWDKLNDLKDQGLFDKIGVAAMVSDDPVGIARRFHPDIIQAPASLLDQRLLVSGALAEIAGLGIEVQLRSIFLQGLLFLPPDRAPAGMKDAASSVSRVRRMIAEGRSDPLQAALAFALSRPEASSVLVGVTSAAELSAVCAAAAHPAPELDWDGMAINDPAALDPRRWAAA